MSKITDERLAKALSGHTVEQLTNKILRRYENDVPAVKQFLREGEDLVLLRYITELRALRSKGEALAWLAYVAFPPDGDGPRYEIASPDEDDAFPVYTHPAPATGVSDAGWRTMDTLEPTDGLSVILCVPSMHEGHPDIVGEATWRIESDGTADWWWAGISPGDYYGSPMSESNAPPSYWQPLPKPPALNGEEGNG